MNYHHIPVLLKEVIECLSPKPGGTFIDATLGGGGYTRAIAQLVGESGKVVAIDADVEAVNIFRLKIGDLRFKDRVVAVHGNFQDLSVIADQYGIKQVDGVVADLGLSSFEIDQSGRGFSFQKDERMDMRFDTSRGDTALDVITDRSEEELERIFSEFGEEKYSKRLARAIVLGREVVDIQTSGQLMAIIARALPVSVRHKAKDAARRIFQALRIEVNQELVRLSEFLEQAFELLRPGGKLAVVSFHSLEDRIVKQFFVGVSGKCICPPKFPECVCGKVSKGVILTKKPVTPLSVEQKQNPRSKSAKLRAIEKL